MDLSKKDIIFWFNQPPNVELGAYNYFSKMIKGNVLYICYDDLPIERKKLNWNNCDYGNAKIKIINHDKKTINNITIDDYLTNEYIHIICGLSGKIADYICPKLKNNNIKFIVVSERPRIVFNKISDYPRSTLLFIKHWIKYIRYNKNVIAFLALGEKGVKQFHKIGWPKSKLYQFMYCGNYDSIKPKTRNNQPNIIKFLYIGRFNYIHGLDILMKTFDSLKNNNWELNLAGGYGEMRDKVLNWSKSKKNVSYLGTIDANMVRNTMKKYDIVIVPSRMDGWNCQINEAISAGVPVITTDEAVSSELVVQSEAGISVNKPSYRELSKEIDYLLLNTSILNVWKQNCLSYNNLFSKKMVGTYLYDILNFSLNNKGDRPKCPWIIKQ